MFFVDFLIGIIVATLAGMGVGGGGLLVLYLVFVKNMDQIEAQGMNLIFFISAATVSLIYHAGKRKINYKLCFFLTVFGSVGAVLGSYTAYRIDPMIVRKVFGWLLIISGSLTLLNKNNKAKENKKI